MDIKKNSKKARLKKQKNQNFKIFLRHFQKLSFIYKNICKSKFFSFYQKNNFIFISKKNFFLFYQKINFIFICKEKKNVPKISPIILIDVADEEYLEKRKAKGKKRYDK